MMRRRLLVVVRKASVDFDETRIRRHPAGSSQGGQFASKAGEGVSPLGVRLAEIMGTQELAEHSTVGEAMQTALGYLHDDRHFAAAVNTHLEVSGAL